MCIIINNVTRCVGACGPPQGSHCTDACALQLQRNPLRSCLRAAARIALHWCLCAPEPPKKASNNDDDDADADNGDGWMLLITNIVIKSVKVSAFCLLRCFFLSLSIFVLILKELCYACFFFFFLFLVCMVLSLWQKLFYPTAYVNVSPPNCLTVHWAQKRVSRIFHQFSSVQTLNVNFEFNYWFFLTKCLKSKNWADLKRNNNHYFHYSDLLEIFFSNFLWSIIALLFLQFYQFSQSIARPF